MSFGVFISSVDLMITFLLLRLEGSKKTFLSSGSGRIVIASVSLAVSEEVEEDDEEEDKDGGRGRFFFSGVFPLGLLDFGAMVTWNVVYRKQHIAT